MKVMKKTPTSRSVERRGNDSVEGFSDFIFIGVCYIKEKVHKRKGGGAGDRPRGRAVLN
jgi:hypothetical protein